MRGQALVELALCAPVILVLALGAVSAVQVVQGQSGLQAATESAVSAAARAPDAPAAIALARSAFSSVVAGYALRAPAISFMAGGFGRGATLSADSTALVDIATGSISLHAHASTQVEPWRSRP